MQGKDWVISSYFWGDLRSIDNVVEGQVGGSRPAATPIATEMPVQGRKLSTEQCRLTPSKLRTRKRLQLSLGNAQGILGTGAELGEHARVFEILLTSHLS